MTETRDAPIASLPIATDLPIVIGLPAVTAAQMADVDRLATTTFGLSLPQMVEQAGSHLAEFARLELGGDLRGRSVVVAVGPGNNGSGGLAAARHLVNRGAAVRVVLARPAARLTSIGRQLLATLLEMSIECCVAVYDIADDELDAILRDADLVIDAVLGYRGSGAPRDDVARLIGRLAGRAGPTISLDVPSGLDADTGIAAGVVVAAGATLTIALPKRGLGLADGPRLAGRIFVADIGIPAAVYGRLGIDVGNPFAAGRILRLEMPA